VKSPSEIQGDNHIFLDTCFLISHIFETTCYSRDAYRLLMDDNLNFVIDDRQKWFLKKKGYGPILKDLSEEMGGRLKVVDNIYNMLKCGECEEGIEYVYDTLVEHLKNFNDHRITDPNWIKRRTRSFTPPQFKVPVPLGAFDKVDLEDVYRFMNATYYNVPLMISDDCHMSGISLITEIMEASYQHKGVSIPHILHPSFVFPGSYMPRVNLKKIDGMIKDWYNSLPREKDLVYVGEIGLEEVLEDSKEYKPSFAET
jgi:hypothetical protein